MSLTNPTIDEIFSLIIKARKFLKNYVKNTPLDYSNTFSRMTGSNVFLKLENLQKTGSFKVRGALFKISNLSDEAKRRGVIAASAGNHAQGVAYAASRLNIPATIVMPEFAPLAKIEATRGYGAKVILHGRTFDEALSKALEFAREKGLSFIHPYDDPYIIAGQGTIGIEIVEMLGDRIDVVVVPVGGGGLISGIAIAIKKSLNKDIKIIGVQTKAFCPYYKMKKNIDVEEKSFTIADGIAVKSIGKITSEIIMELVDDIVLVDDDEISNAIYLLLERAKTLAEGAGATALAALLAGKIGNIKNKNVVAIVSGGNMDLSLLTKLIIRELVKERKLVNIVGIIPDIPGSLMHLLSTLAELRANVIDIIHNRYSSTTPPGYAKVEIIAEVHNVRLLKEKLGELKSKGFVLEIGLG